MKRWLKLVLVGLSTSVIVVLVAVFFREGLEAHKIWLAAARYIFFIALIGFWPELINIIAKKRQWSSALQAQVLSKRWPLAAWIVFIELLVVQNVWGKFWELWF